MKLIRIQLSNYIKIDKNSFLWYICWQKYAKQYTYNDSNLRISKDIFKKNFLIFKHVIFREFFKNNEFECKTELKFISFTFHLTLIHSHFCIHVDYSMIRMKMKILSSTIHMQLLFQIKKKREIFNFLQNF